MDAVIATATPSAASTSSERPTTFEQGFAQQSAAESQTATTSVDTTTAPARADATVPPVSATSPEAAAVTPDAKGPIPFDRHDAIVKGFHTQVDQLKAELDTLGWAKTVPQQTLKEWTGIANRISSDPVAFIQELQREIEAHPTFGPQLRSHAARTLASGRQAPQIPDVQVQDETGKPIGSLREMVTSLARELVNQEVGPLKQDFDTRQQHDRQAEHQRQVHSAVDALYDTATKELPHFKEHEADIAKAMESIDGEAGTALYRAWAKVVLPKLDAKSKAAHLETLQTRAQSGTVNPATPAAAITKRPTSFYDPSLKW